MVRIYVLIDVAPGEVWRVIDDVRKIEGVKMADVVAGPHDIVAVVEVETIQRYSEIAKKIHAIRGVMKTMSLIAV